jgi:hypothetical protein
MLAGMVLLGAPGCSLIFPDVSHEPLVHNPFPQLNRVAVAPFFNQSDEPTVDGRKFAMAYYAELQAIPGFEVVPLGVVETAIIENQVDLHNPDEARRLANILGVDAVVIGAVTDFTPYYPPRCGLRVDWYSANPGFHEIPPGYGLPWGTPEEEYIPAPLVFESEFALAKAQLKTQTPACPPQSIDPPAPPVQETGPAVVPGSAPAPPANNKKANDTGKDNAPEKGSKPSNSTTSSLSPYKKRGRENAHVTRALYAEPAAGEELPKGDSTASNSSPVQSGPDAGGVTTGAIGAHGPEGPHDPLGPLPSNWPDERGFIPPPPSPERPACCPHNGPVMTHTRIYSGSDSEFTEALASYYHFRDDARFGGWQNYLQRTDDFIRFCCHMHLSEMLSARGGAGETRVVWQWSDCR